MLRVAHEEQPWMDIFTAQAVTVDALDITVRECPAQEGVLFSLICKERLCGVWLAADGWQRWCEAVVGTDDMAALDPLLLNGIAEWALSPLLHTANAVLCRDHPPLLCSALPHQLALCVGWQVDKHDFHALLFDWPPFFWQSLAAKAPPPVRQIHPCPPVFFPLYIGWSELTLAEMSTIETDAGVRLSCFGNARAGMFAVVLPGGISARVWLTTEKTMKFEELVEDIETLLATESGSVMEETTQPVDVDQIAQKIVFEVGQAAVELGRLRQLQAGDILPASGHFTPEVTLRLISGQAVGRGELVACGSEFLVRITHWFLKKDTVNT